MMIAAAAAVVLLAVGFAYQSWQISRLRAQVPDSAPDAGNVLPDGVVPAEKTALIKEILNLNDTLDAEALAELSMEELEQLRAAGAPGMPIGLNAAAYAAEEFAGTLEVDSITSTAEPKLNEKTPYYQIMLHHITKGDFYYKVDAYTGDILSGLEDIFSYDDPLNGLTSSETNSDASEAVEPLGAIGEIQAKKTALSDAGFAEEDTERCKVWLALDDGHWEYEVEFYANGMAYKYKIDALTGGILQSKQETGYTPPAPAEKTLTAEQAAAIACADAGVKADSVSSLWTNLDWDNDLCIFEVEFVCDGIKYEYELNALDGAIRKSEQKTNSQVSVNPPASNQPSSYTFIGDAAAKEIAFQHAGVSAQNVRELEFELDREHGLYYYEIEFTVGSTDYEYEIDAVTGMVLKAEMD